MFLVFLFFDPTKNFLEAIVFGGEPIFKIASFQEYLFFFFTRFSAQSNSNVLVVWFLPCFEHI